MRKQYTYFRDIAMKRLKRLGVSEFADSQSYLKNIKQFKKLSIQATFEAKYEKKPVFLNKKDLDASL